MPVIRINAIDSQPRLHGSPRCPDSALQRASNTPGPIIIMTHGYKYRPYLKKACPHQHILSLSPSNHDSYSPSWPRQLGFGAGFEDEGLAIAFGWDARGSLWAAHRRAIDAGRVLADVIGDLHRKNPGRPIHFIGHSMGIELALEALHHVPPGALHRIIAMTGAVYRSRTLEALGTPAGRQAELINVTSRENDLFDFLHECVIQPPKRGDCSIGAGIEAENAVTLQIDCPETVKHLSGRIFPVAPAHSRVCHWSSYTRPGVLRVYNALLRNPDQISLNMLRAGLPATASRRWSRLFALPRPHGLLPFAQKAS